MTSSLLSDATEPSPLHPIGSPPLRREAAGQGSLSAAEADGNRTRQARLDASPVLKTGVGRCHM